MVVGRIFVFPVKSGRGVELESARVTSRGLEDDRRWMVVDERGEFLTQREMPAMALLSVDRVEDGVVLRFPGMPELPLGAVESGPPRSVLVWGDRCDALSAGPAAAEWIGRSLGRPAEIVRMPGSTVRRAPAKYDDSGSLVSFADAFPLLVLSSASVDALAERLGRALDVRRFRANLVIDGCAPHAEDGWRTIAVGETVLRIVKPCSRCTIVNVDPTTAEPSREPLATLATYRATGNKVLFGQNAVIAGAPPDARIRVGDEVRVLEAL